jgi:lipoprotein-anchoring transpeptidase ErfK/SrfK
MRLEKKYLLFLLSFAALTLNAADFISVPGPVPSPSKISNTAVFVKSVANRAEIKSAKWNLSGLGVFRAYINGKEVGAEDFLKPGYTHVKKRRSSFLYDVTAFLDLRKGAENIIGIVTINQKLVVSL